MSRRLLRAFLGLRRAERKEGPRRPLELEVAVEDFSLCLGFSDHYFSGDDGLLPQKNPC